MPQLGDVKTGKELGYRNHWSQFLWCACRDCGREAWVVLIKGSPKNDRCSKCAGKAKRGKLNPMWKRERWVGKDGYVWVRLYPEDFYGSMASKSNSVLEHRLVMAKHLGRPLHTWEMVHHKGIRHIGIENRSDNLSDNLKLTMKGSHSRE
ncbi:hypothetical protein LCGC14_2757110, partial [marine sediment metagenome]